jgi:hypothetical protein
MNADDKQREVKPSAEPTAPSPLFAMPLVTNGELVPASSSSPVVPRDQPQPADQVEPDERQPLTWTSGLPMTALVLTAAERAAQAAERDRLLGLCRHLRRTHRCPGQCVLSEVRQERRLRELGHNELSGGGQHD